MKKLLVFLLALMPLGLAAQDLTIPHISVTGVAKRMVAPDLMEWGVQVQTQGVEVPVVAEAQRKTVAEVLRFLAAAGIQEQRMQTARMQLQENWQYREGGRHRDGFIATTFIRFDSPRLDLYDALWGGLSRIRNVSINHVNLTLADPETVRDEVKVDALRAARDKARTMATTLDASLGQVVRIAETQGDFSPVPRMAAVEQAKLYAADSGGDSGMAAGQIEVRAEVFVTFILIGQ